MNGWINNLEAGDLRHHHAHNDVAVMMRKYDLYDFVVIELPINVYAACGHGRAFRITAALLGKPVTCGFPSYKDQECRTMMVSLLFIRISCWTNNCRRFESDFPWLEMQWRLCDVIIIRQTVMFARFMYKYQYMGHSCQIYFANINIYEICEFNWRYA